MLSELKLFKRMLKNGQITRNDLTKIYFMNKFSNEEFFKAIIESNQIKYLTFYYPLVKEDQIIKYKQTIMQHPKKIELILDIYENHNNFPIMDYLDMIINEGNDDDNLRLAILLTTSTEDLQNIENTLNKILTIHPQIYEKFKFLESIEEFKKKDIQEFSKILIEKDLLTYFIQHFEIETFKDLERLYYFLKANNSLEKAHLLKFKNKVIEFIKKDNKDSDYLKKIIAEIGLVEFSSFVVILDGLNKLYYAFKQMILKELSKNYIENELILRVYFDYFEGIEINENFQKLDTEYKNLIGNIEENNSNTKVYQKVSTKLWKKIMAK